MQKNRRTFIAAGLTTAAVPAFAQFGGMLGGKTAGGGNFEADMNAFLQKSFNIEMTASRASLAIASAFAAEADRAKFQSLFDDVGKQTNPNEAGAKFQQVKETAEAEIKRLSESKDLGEQTKALSEEKKKLLAKGVGNFLLAVFQAKDLIPNGQGIFSSASSNPMNITKLAPLKDALSRLQSAGGMAGSAIPKFIDALKGANVSVTTASSSSKEEPIDKI
jgi:hypothetical protein